MFVIRLSGGYFHGMGSSEEARRGWGVRIGARNGNVCALVTEDVERAATFLTRCSAERLAVTVGGQVEERPNS